MKKIILVFIATLFITSCARIGDVTGFNKFTPNEKLQLLIKNANDYSDGNKTGSEYYKEFASLQSEARKNNDLIKWANGVDRDAVNEIISCYNNSYYGGSDEQKCVVQTFKNKIPILEQGLEKEKEYQESQARLSDYLNKIKRNKLQPTKNNLFLFCDRSARSIANIAMTPFATGVRIASKYDEMRYLLMDDKIVWGIKKITGDNYDYQLMYTVYLRECESNPSGMIINYDKIFKK